MGSNQSVYYFPNIYQSAGGVQVVYINPVGGPTASGTQNKNGGVITYANPGATQSRFHKENDGNIVAGHVGRYGGFPVNTSGIALASGEMGIFPILGANGFGKVYPQQYLMYQLKPVQQVGGVTSTVLQTAGARFNGVDRAIMNANPGFVYTMHYGGGYAGFGGSQQGFNYVTGRFLVAPSGTKDTFAQDKNAIVNGTIQSPLVYLDAGKTIASGLYKNRTLT